MSRVERVSSLSLSRIRGAYVERQRGTDSIEKALAVEPVFYAQNNTNLSSENHLIAYDNFYRHFAKLEKEFDHFLKDRKNLEEEVKEEKKKAKQDRNSDLYKKIKTMINKYNSTIEALIYIDKNYHTNNLQELKVIILNHEDNMKNLGINSKDLFLEINGGIFWKNFLNSQDPYEELFKPLSRLIMALFIKFRNIMVIKKNDYNSFSEDYKGTIINQSF